jgi:hypothetical protein
MTAVIPPASTPSAASLPAASPRVWPAAVTDADRLVGPPSPVSTVRGAPVGLQTLAPRWAEHEELVPPFAGRSRRVRLLDRPWVGFRGVALVTPLDLPSVEDARALLAAHLRAHPGSVLARRIDVRRGRWVPVPAAEIEAHVRRLVRPAPAVTPERLAELGVHDAGAVMIDDHLARDAHDLPIAFGFGPDHLTVSTSHVMGDMATCTKLMQAVTTLDAGLLAALTPETRLGVHVGAVLRGLRTHGRGWLAHLRGGAGGPATVAADVDAAVVPAERPGFEELVLPQDRIRAITKWRNTNAKGASITAALTTLVHRALVAEGLPVEGSGFFTLFDTRGMLPPTEVLRPGNLAKALWIAADVDDPHAVGAALDAAIKTRRALPAVVAGTLGTLRGCPPGVRPARAGTPLVLTMNSAPSMPGVADLPWREDGVRRFLPMGHSAGPGGITVFAIRQRESMQLVATFDEATACRDAVRRALESLTTL